MPRALPALRDGNFLLHQNACNPAQIVVHRGRFTTHTTYPWRTSRLLHWIGPKQNTHTEQHKRCKQQNDFNKSMRMTYNIHVNRWHRDRYGLMHARMQNAIRSGVYRI